MYCTTKSKAPSSRFVTIPQWENSINEFFNTAVGDVVRQKRPGSHFNPLTNVVEYKDRFELELAIPGFSKKEVTITVENELLKVVGKKELNQEDVKFRLREFNQSFFNKTFRLPESIDENQISAKFSLGVLRLELNKKPEAVPQPIRNISIK